MSVAQLRGRRLGVDALTTGYAFVLREILARQGVRFDDVEWVKAGGVLQRFEVLHVNGSVSGGVAQSPSLRTISTARVNDSIGICSEPGRPCL